jgi:hypothetical protein
MRTSIARAATAAIALAVVGGTSLAAATHAAAATPNYTCATMEFTQPVVVLKRLRIPPQLVGLTGCNLPATGIFMADSPGTVTGQVIGWANPRSFSFSGYRCFVPGTCNFFDVTLLPNS